jgi:hypothetical protein
MTDPAFVFPTDREYLALKSQYSFPEGDLDLHFTAFARDMVGEMMTHAKQHNLLRFRELLLSSSETPPPLLFTYIPGKLCQNPSLSGLGLRNFKIDSILMWPDEPANYVLADEIQKVYPPPITWTFRYFVMVTFPAAFGHFLSCDYLDGGLRFIRSHVGQRDTVVQLVASYLLHCFLFRDRLLEVFCRQLAVNQSALTEDAFLDAFVPAFQFCVRYFAPQHIEAVRLLVTQHGTKTALDALISYFLCVVVQSWQFSPLLAGLDLPARTERAASDRYVRKGYILKDRIMRFARRKDAEEKLLRPLFNCPTTEVPMFATIVPTTRFGIRFDLSLVDEVLVVKLLELLNTFNGRHPRTIVGIPETAVSDAFRLHKTITLFFEMRPRVPRPQPKDPTPLPTRQKLLDRVALHKFFFAILHPFRLLHLVLEAQRRLISYQSRLFVNRLTNCSISMNPAAFHLTQWIDFAFTLFQGYLCPPPLEQFVNARGKTEAQHKMELERLFRQNASLPIEEAILSSAVGYVNDWKAAFKAENERTVLHMTQIGDEEDRRYTRYFCEAVRQMTEAWTINYLSNHPVCLLSRTDLGRDEMSVELAAELERHSEDWELLVGDPELLRLDQPEEQVAEWVRSFGCLQYFLKMANLVAMGTFQKGEAHWGTGDHLLFFLRVEEIVNFYWGTLKDWQSTEPKFMTKLFESLTTRDDPRGPLWIRGWLLKVFKLVNLIRQPGSEVMENFGEIQNQIITPQMVESLKRLRDFFGFSHRVFE